MKNVKLCGLIVLVAILVPCVVGFAWPSEQGTTTTDVIGNYVDVSEDLYNGSVPVYGNYTDPYNNNFYILSKTAVSPNLVLLSNGVDYTSTVTQIPGYVLLWTSKTVTLDASGEYEIDLESWKAQYSSDIIVWDAKNFDSISINGDVASRVIYYPKTEQLYYVTELGYSMVQTDPANFIMEGTANQTVNLFYSYALKSSTYADLNQGFQAPGQEAYWYNGYSNRGIDILLKPALDSDIKFTFPLDWGFNLEIHIYCDAAGNISYTFDDTGFHDSGTLGDTAAYPYLLLNLDYDTQSINLSGLMGLNSFLSDYQGAIRKTVTADWTHVSAFTMMKINSSDRDFSFFIPRTIAAVGSVPGIHPDGFFSVRWMDLNNYQGDNSQIQLRNVNIWPNTSGALQIYVDGTTYYGELNIDGMITFTVGSESYTFPIDALTITKLDKAIYINGTKIIELPQTILSCKIGFYGDWALNIYYWPISKKTELTYQWEPGIFGLNTVGFCLVGLLASASMAIVALLYGRYSGSKIALVLITAGCSCAVYLVLLMQAL